MKPDVTIPKKLSNIAILDNRFIISKFRLNNDNEDYVDFNEEGQLDFYFYKLKDLTQNKIYIKKENEQNYCAVLEKTDFLIPNIDENRQLDSMTHKLDYLNTMLQEVTKEMTKESLNDLYSIPFKLSGFDDHKLIGGSKVYGVFFKEVAKDILLKAQKNSSEIKNALSDFLIQFYFFNRITEEEFIEFNEINFLNNQIFFNNLASLLYIINEEFHKMDFNEFNFIKEVDFEPIDIDHLKIIRGDSLASNVSITVTKDGVLYASGTCTLDSNEIFFSKQLSKNVQYEITAVGTRMGLIGPAISKIIKIN